LSSGSFIFNLFSKIRKKILFNSLASSLPIFANLAKISPERVYMRVAYEHFPAHLVSTTKDMVQGEKNTRKKNLVEGLKRVQKQIQSS
jgi:hypothetical protein